MELCFQGLSSLSWGQNIKTICTSFGMEMWSSSHTPYMLWMVHGGARCYCRSYMLLQCGPAGWLGKHPGAALYHLSALLLQLGPHLELVHIKLHKEWFQFLQVIPMIKIADSQVLIEVSGSQRVLVECTSALGAPVCPSFSLLHIHLASLTACPGGTGSNTRHCSSRLTETAQPAPIPAGSATLIQPWTLCITVVFIMICLVYFSLCPTLCLSKAGLTLQKWFKAHPLLEAFPGI